MRVRIFLTLSSWSLFLNFSERSVSEVGLLFSEELKHAIECLLFVASEPLSIKKISEIVNSNNDTINTLLLEIQQEYQGRGFELYEIAGGWQFLTRSEFACYIEKLYRPKVHLLSKAALETLAIIAYKQPITRPEVEAIRGVKIEKVLGTLFEKRLVQEVGRMDGPGRPILYGTTDKFLSNFGFKSLKDLPKLEDFFEGENLSNNENEKED